MFDPGLNRARFISDGETPSAGEPTLVLAPGMPEPRSPDGGETRFCEPPVHPDPEFIIVSRSDMELSQTLHVSKLYTLHAETPLSHRVRFALGTWLARDEPTSVCTRPSTQAQSSRFASVTDAPLLITAQRVAPRPLASPLPSTCGTRCPHTRKVFSWQPARRWETLPSAG